MCGGRRGAKEEERRFRESEEGLRGRREKSRASGDARCAPTHAAAEHATRTVDTFLDFEGASVRPAPFFRCILASRSDLSAPEYRRADVQIEAQKQPSQQPGVAGRQINVEQDKLHSKAKAPRKSGEFVPPRSGTDADRGPPFWPENI